MDTCQPRATTPLDPLLQRLQQVRGRPIQPMSLEQLNSFRQQAHRREFARVQRQAIQQRLFRLMHQAEVPPLVRFRFASWPSHQFERGEQVLEHSQILAQKLADNLLQCALLLGDAGGHMLHLAAAMVNHVHTHTQTTWLTLPARQLVEAVTLPCARSRTRRRIKAASDTARLIRQAELLLILDVDELSPAQQQLLARQLQWRQQHGLKSLITSRWDGMAQWQELVDPLLRDTMAACAPEVIQLNPLNLQLGFRNHS